jgi:hypothetical protein
LNSHRPIVEIGILFGQSTMIIAESKPLNQPLFSIDNFCWNPCGLSPEVHKNITFARLADWVNGCNMKIICMEKSRFYRDYSDERPAMVFLDADHSYLATKEDIDWALSQRADLICGHDYSSEFPGVIQAVNESGGVEKIVDSLWVLKRLHPVL